MDFVTLWGALAPRDLPAPIAGVSLSPDPALAF